MQSGFPLPTVLLDELAVFMVEQRINSEVKISVGYSCV